MTSADDAPIVASVWIEAPPERQIRGSSAEVRPPHRVVFTWGDAGSTELPPGATRVEVDLHPTAGGTTVTLQHHGLRGGERADHGRGWPIKLEALRSTA